MILDQVPGDHVVEPTRHDDAHPERRIGEREGRCGEVVVVVDVVPGDQEAPLGSALDGVHRVRHDPGHVVRPLAVHDRDPFGVGPAEARGVVLADDGADHRMARRTTLDGEARVSRAARVGMVELAVIGAVGGDAGPSVVVRGEVPTPVAVHAVPREAVQEVVAGRQVLDRNAVGCEHLYPVRALEPAIDDRPIAIETADREVWRRDRHGLRIDPRADQDHPPRLGVIDGRLDRFEVLRYPDRCGVPGWHGFASRSHAGGKSLLGRDPSSFLRSRDRNGQEPDEGRRHGQDAVQQGSSPHRRGP